MHAYNNSFKYSIAYVNRNELCIYHDYINTTRMCVLYNAHINNSGHIQSLQYKNTPLTRSSIIGFLSCTFTVPNVSAELPIANIPDCVSTIPYPKYCEI